MIILGGKSTLDSFPLNYALNIPRISPCTPPLVAAMGSSAEMPPAPSFLLLPGGVVNTLYN